MRLRPHSAHRRLTMAVIAMVIAMSVQTTAAGAAEPAASGWWSAVPGLDTRQGHMLVQGGVGDDPLAFAAMAFDLPAGIRLVSLTVAVAPGGISTPGAVLAVCPLTSALRPARGAPMREAPTYDCADRVTAGPSDDGRYRFEVDGTSDGEPVAFAVLPTATTDRVELDEPGDETLEVDVAAGDPARGAEADVTGGETARTEVQTPAAGGGRAEPQRTTMVSPATDRPAAAPGDDPHADQPLSIGRAVTPLPTDVEQGSTALFAVFLAAVAAAGLLWTLAGRERAWGGDLGQDRLV